MGAKAKCFSFKRLRTTDPSNRQTNRQRTTKRLQLLTINQQIQRTIYSLSVYSLCERYSLSDYIWIWRASLSDSDRGPYSLLSAHHRPQHHSQIHSHSAHSHSSHRVRGLRVTSGISSQLAVGHLHLHIYPSASLKELLKTLHKHESRKQNAEAESSKTRSAEGFWQKQPVARG